MRTISWTLAAACLVAGACSLAAAQQTQIMLTRQAPPSFTPGQPIELTVTISAAGPGMLTAIGVYETLPPNWTFAGVRGVTADPPSISPAPGQTELLEFAWITPPTFPAIFAYTVIPPEEAGGIQYISGQVEYRESAGALKSNVEITELNGPDNRPPTLTLLGDNPMVVEQGSGWSDPGATANDETDGDLSNRVQRSGQPDTSRPGVYAVEYSVVDSAGNRVSATRTVEVVERQGTGNGGASPRPRAPNYNRDLYSGGGRPNPQRPNTPGNPANPPRAPESALSPEALKAAARQVAAPPEVTTIPEGVGVPASTAGTDRRPLDQNRLQQIVGRIGGKGAASEDRAETAEGAGAATEPAGVPPTDGGAVPAPVVAESTPVAALAPALPGNTPPPADPALAAVTPQAPPAPGFLARVGTRLGRMGAMDFVMLGGALAVIAAVAGLAIYGWRSAYRGGKRRPAGPAQ
jgi:hypothetical protein